MIKSEGPVQATFKFYHPHHGEVTYTCELDKFELELETIEPEDIWFNGPSIDGPICFMRVKLLESNIVPGPTGKYGQIKTKRTAK